MQPVEALDFFSTQLARAEKGLFVAKSARNYQLLALNARQVFRTQLMLGLITWGQGEDANQLISSAVDSLVENAAVLRKLNVDAPVVHDLPLERAAIAGFLVGKDIDMPAGALEVKAPDRVLDWMLVSALNSGQVSIDIEFELGKLSQASPLAAQSYLTYFEALDRCAKGIPADDLLQAAEENFRNRARDGFYSGGDQTEGGGPDNKLVVDYRLAAVLKKVNYLGASAHFWRW